MKIDSDLAKEWEWSIREAIALNSEIEADEDESILFSDVEDVNTFKEKGILTMDNGVVVTLNDGSKIHITIQAYSERR